MMNLLLRLAWRNIWRSPRRTILTVLAIAFATAVLMFFMSIQLESYDTGIKATTSLFHGHLQIQPAGYFDKPQMRKALKNVDAITRVLSQDQSVIAYSPRAFASVLVSTGDRSYGVQVVGVEPSTEPGVSTVSESVRVGSYLSTDDTLDCLIGVGLAKNLKVTVNDEITILGQGYDGSLASSVLRVKGIYETGSYDLDRLAIHIPLREFNEIFALQGAVHTVATRVAVLDDIDKVQHHLLTELQGEKLSNIAVLRWDQLLPGVKQSMKLDMSAGWMFFGALIVIVFFSVLNTFLMSVLERTKEFGVVLSLGMNRATLTILVCVEAVFLALVGILVGIVLGSIVVGLLHVYGFTIPGTDEIRKMWNLPATLYPDLTFEVLAVGPLILFIASVLSAVYPAYRARTINLLQALRGVR